MAPVTLETVRRDLEHWRGTREKSGRIPNRIWTQALNLLEQHSMSEICRVLRLSHTQLKNKIKQHDPFTIKSDAPFYEVAMPSIKHQQTDIKRILPVSTIFGRKDTNMQQQKMIDIHRLLNYV